jgi:hypothetical protein
MRPRLYFRSWQTVFSLLFLTIQLAAQEPFRVAFACAEDDLQSAGMSCTDEDPCPIYLELSSIARDGRNLFAAGNLHSTSATIASILLLSEDGGVTWKEPAMRIRGAALEQIQFYNLQTGWVAGGTQYPLPRDPFILITTDGGESWRNIPIEEDGAPGYVQRFWFDSAQHGELIVDSGKSAEGGRYSSYESETGGTSWTLRGKSDQLPKLRRAPPSVDNPDLRVRPSNDGKVYNIEPKTGAPLLIEVAGCRRQPTELAEPPTK